MKPIWLKQAEHYIGLKEVYGSKHNPTILQWWIAIRAPFTDDETPWCAGFVGGVLEFCGLKSSRSAAARSYLSWGMKLDKPAVGAIVVFWRGSPSGYSGHVGFVEGIDSYGNLMVLGGNQGDMVSVKPFSRDRVLGYRWPKDIVATPSYSLPIVSSNGRLSNNEE